MVALCVCGASAVVVLMPQRFALAAGTQQPLEVVSVDTTAAPEVRITVAVPRELVGHPLDADAFTVLEAGRKRIPTLTRLPGDPLAVELVIDTSGSMRGAPIEAARAAAIQFIDRMPSGTQIGVVGFSDAPAVISPFTTDRTALTNAINGVAVRGETALYDGVATAASQLATTSGTRRVTVLLSDGGDTASSANIDTAASALASASSTVYAAALVTPETDLPALDRLAASAGGRVVSASDPTELAKLYDDIAVAITNQYQLAFKATSTGTVVVRASVDADGVQAATELTVDLGSAAPVAPIETRPVRATTASASLLGGASWALVIGGVLIFLALVIGGLVLLAPRERLSTIAVERRVSAPRRHEEAIGDLVGGASRFADRALERRGRRSALNDALERAGIDMRPGEFMVLATGATLAVLFLGLLLLGPVIGLVLGAITALAFRMAVSIRADRRRARFADQLGDTLQLIAGSLRSGHGLLHAVDTVAEEAESPTCEEFRRIVVETRLGKNLRDALQATALRVRNEDFDWVVDAIDIHREVGGDLAEVLDHVATTIRSRNSIRRQVKALSAEGRLSAVILFLLPLGLVAVIATLNPSYLDELLDTTAGNVMIGFAFALLVLGGIWMRRVVRIVF
jgi:tight adherence protein B